VSSRDRLTLDALYEEQSMLLRVLGQARSARPDARTRSVLVEVLDRLSGVQSQIAILS
jgi:hypothetical protein